MFPLNWMLSSYNYKLASANQLGWEESDRDNTIIRNERQQEMLENCNGDMKARAN